MAGRKIRDRGDAERCLAALKRSKASTIKEWAQGHGIDGRSLQAWKNALERSGTTLRAKKRRPVVAPVRLVELMPVVPRSDRGARYVVTVGKAQIEVDDGFREETLTRLVRALSPC
jgi:hypothetical protein